MNHSRTFCYAADFNFFSAYFKALGLENPSVIRDLWRQTDLHDAEWKIPTHGVRLLKVTP